MKNLAKYTVGIFAGIFALFALSEGAYAGAGAFSLAAAFLLPPIFDSIKNTFTINPSRDLYILVVFFAMVAGFMFSANTDEATIAEKPESASQEISAQDNSKEAKQTSPSVKKKPVDDVVIITEVVDGDTVNAKRGDTTLKIRLIGIDTPELSHPSEPVQCFSSEAKKALEELILNKKVRLEKDISETDKYNRLLRYVWLEDILVNEFMVQNGYAFASAYPPDVKYQDLLSNQEKTAQTELRGLWAVGTCNGDVYTGTYLDPAVKAENDYSETPTGGSSAPPVYSQSDTPDTSSDSSSDSESYAGSYACSCSKTCTQMATCEEAYYQLNVCGCSARDGDDDGVPCESLCL